MEQGQGQSRCPTVSPRSKNFAHRLICICLAEEFLSSCPLPLHDARRSMNGLPIVPPNSVHFQSNTPGPVTIGIGECRMFYILATLLDAILSLTPARRTSEQQPQGSRREITVIYEAIYDPFSGGPTQTPIIEGY